MIIELTNFLCVCPVCVDTSFLIYVRSLPRIWAWDYLSPIEPTVLAFSSYEVHSFTRSFAVIPLSRKRNRFHESLDAAVTRLACLLREWLFFFSFLFARVIGIQREVGRNEISRWEISTVHRSMSNGERLNSVCFNLRPRWKRRGETRASVALEFTFPVIKTISPLAPTRHATILKYFSVTRSAVCADNRRASYPRKFLRTHVRYVWIIRQCGDGITKYFLYTYICIA